MVQSPDYEGANENVQIRLGGDDLDCDQFSARRSVDDVSDGRRSQIAQRITEPGRAHAKNG